MHIIKCYYDIGGDQMSAKDIIKKLDKNERLSKLVKANRWKRIEKQFDTNTKRFKNIDHTANKVREEYGEDIYDQLAQRYVYRYISRFDDEIAETAKKLKETIKPVSQPFTIFTMWWQGENEMPPIVKPCVKSFDKLGEKVVIITKDNYSDYVSMPDYIISAMENGKMCLAHFSDIIRTYLIIKYGGVWIDSTVYIARSVPEYMTKSFFVFKQSHQLRECRSYGNWWIASPPANDMLIDELAYLYCYWKHHDVAMHYYIYHVFFRRIIDNNPDYKKKIDAIPTRITDSTHLLADRYSTPFDPKLWEEIKEISPVFKCSYKIKGDSSYDNFYNRLCNNQLD